jgi:predicted amidophosphoribosyltransferase
VARHGQSSKEWRDAATGPSCPLCGAALTAAPEDWGTAHYWCPQCALPFVKERVRQLAIAERPFAVGDRVLVMGPPGEVLGEVIEAATPNEMPDLGPESASHQAHQIMHGWRVDFLVVIRHEHQGQLVGFFALHHPGGWRDLRGQYLRITKVRKG